MYLSRDEDRGLIGIQDTVETAILGWRNYERNSKERFLIAACTIEEDEDRETPRSTKREKRRKGKHSRYKNNYWNNLSGKQWVKQVKTGGDG